MDFLTRKRRSKLMSRVRGKNTTPELVVRRIVRNLGFKFTANDPSLPASPDLCFPSAHKVIFVHGCFWHRHRRCAKATMPKTRVAFWRSKFDRNKRRDRTRLRQLNRLGWKTMVIWECETRFPGKTARPNSSLFGNFMKDNNPVRPTAARSRTASKGSKEDACDTLSVDVMSAVDSNRAYAEVTTPPW